MSGGALVVSIHDVAPATADAARRLRGLVTRCAGEVPVSLLVVPRYHAGRCGTTTRAPGCGSA